MPFYSNKSGNKVAAHASEVELDIRKKLRRMCADFQAFVSDVEWNVNNSFLFTSRQSLSRLLYFNDLYKLVIGKPGVICEFGVQFGATLSLLTNLRGIHEPYNYTRHVVGFDTFSGFAASLNDEEKRAGWSAGDYSVPEGFEEYLSALLTTHEQNAPVSHRTKFELVKGDVTETFVPWLDANPHIIVALAIFDMDVYAPTKHVLERVISVMPKGGILAFDELNCAVFPGETQALREVLGTRNLALQHNPHNPLQSWCVLG